MRTLQLIGATGVSAILAVGGITAASALSSPSAAPVSSPVSAAASPSASPAASTPSGSSTPSASPSPKATGTIEVPAGGVLARHVKRVCHRVERRSDRREDAGRPLSKRLTSVRAECDKVRPELSN